MDNLITSNIRQRPVRTVVCVAGIALGVCLVMLFTGLATGLSNDLQRRNSNVKGEIIFTRPGSMNITSSLANLSTQYVARLKEIEGVADAVPVILYFYPDKKGFGVERAEGVEWDSFAKMNGLTIVEGRGPVANDEIVIDDVKSRTDRLRVGSTVTLWANRQYRVVGIYAPESGARTKMALSAMQDALEAQGKSTYILVKVSPGQEPLTVLHRIDKQLEGNKVQLTPDVFGNIEATVPALKVFLRTLVVLAAIVSALVVMLAMYTTITERTREIGILKALGASRGYIIGIIEKEALLISVIGLALGFLTSMVAGIFIRRAFGLLFQYTWKWALTAAIIGVVGAIVGALYPAFRASNLDPVHALSYD